MIIIRQPNIVPDTVTKKLEDLIGNSSRSGLSLVSQDPEFRLKIPDGSYCELKISNFVSSALYFDLGSWSATSLTNGVVDDCFFFGSIFLDAYFASVSFNRTTFYSNLMSGARFTDCHFKDCEFLGATVEEATFTDCTFQRVRVWKDNIGSSCSFDATRFESCSIDEASHNGLEAAGAVLCGSPRVS